MTEPGRILAVGLMALVEGCGENHNETLVNDVSTLEMADALSQGRRR